MSSRSLAKMAYRDLISRKTRTLGLILTIGIGVGVYGAIKMALSSIPSTLKEFYAWSSFADLHVTLLPEDAGNLPDLTAIPGVKSVSKRLIFPGTVFLPGGRSLSCLLILLENPEPSVDKVRLLSGRMFRPSAGELVAESGLQRYHGIRVGDSLRVRIGEKEYADAVVGTAISPEFFVTTSNPDYALQEKGTLGVVFGDLDRISEGLGFALVNDLAFRYEAGSDPAAVKDRILKALAGHNVERVAGQEESFSHQKIMLGVECYSIYTLSIILTLLALAFMVGTASFFRSHAERRQQFATAMAMGHTRFSIATVQAFAGCAVGLPAGLAGIAISLLGRNLFTRSYAHAHGIPMVINHTDSAMLGMILLAAAFIGALASLTAFLWSTGSGITRLLRPSPPPVTRQGIPGFSLRLPGTTLPYSLRNLFRKPIITSFSALSLAFAISVPIAYGVCTTSNVDSIAASFRQDAWEYAVDFRHPVFREDGMPATIDGGSPGESAPAQRVPYYRHFVEAGNGGSFLGAKLVGLDPDNGLLAYRLKSGHVPLAGTNQAVASRDITEKLGLALGDKLTLRHGSEESEFTLCGTTDDYFTRQLLVPLTEAQQLGGMPGKITGYYQRGDGGRIRKPAFAGAQIAQVTAKGKLLEGLVRMGKESMGIVRIATGFSLLMVLAFATVLMSTAMSERKGEFAVLRSLGFGDNKIAKLVLCESAAILAAASLLCIPVAGLLIIYLNGRMSKAWFHIDLHLGAWDLLTPILLAFATAPIISLACVASAWAEDPGRELRYRNIN